MTHRTFAWTFAARIGDKYQIRLARPTYKMEWAEMTILRVKQRLG